MPANIEWQCLTQGGTPPTPRSGHSMIFVGASKYLMYGGITSGASGNKVAPISDIYTLRMTRTDWVWEKQDCSGAEKPGPRAQHVALNVGNDKMFVFGGHASPTCRLNDTWMLNVKEYTWTRCKGDKTVGDNKLSPIGAPSPRANAASCYYQGKVYVYGGHGGLNYSRISLDDVYCFDVETETWEYLEAVVGLQPLPLGRGGHSIFCAEGKLYSYGGWNAEATYNQTICFDLTTHEWSDPDIFSEKPRWNHSAIMVEAIPSWKYFIFGGESAYFSEGASRNFGDCQDTACYLDLAEMKWTTIAPENNEKPPVREYSSMVYDSDESRLIIFGGWNTGWLNDLYVLNVSKVVGPPYAISSIEPQMAQMSGGMPLVIKGVGFRDNNCQVYFTCGKDTPAIPNKNSLFVPGIYISDTEMHCQSPNFSIHGPKDAMVQLMMSNKDLTTTACPFGFYLNTRAAKSLCYGTGVLADGQVGEEAEFIIQARNDNGENRFTGNDDFIVLIKTKGTEETPSVEIPSTIVDKDDGSYSVKYTCEVEGEVSIKINYRDESGNLSAVRGMPYTASFIADAAPKANQLVGPQLQKHCVQKIEELQAFMKETTSGLNTKEKDLTNVNQLLGVKDCVEDCVNKNDDIVLQLDQLQESLKVLLANNIGKENQLKQVEKLTDNFTVLKKSAKEVKKEITPLVNTEGQKNINYIAKLEEDLKAYSAAMKKRDFYKYAFGRGPALEKLDGVFDELGTFITRIADLGSNAAKFGSPESIEVPEKQVEGIKNEVNAMKQLWDHIAVCQQQFEDNMATSWPNIDPFAMEESVKKLLSALKNMKVDKRADAYDGLMKEIKKWLVFLPLIGELRSESMRERHWDMIRKLVESEFAVDDSLYLRDIYEMNLAQFAEDVEEITDQARQEAKMEKTLQKLRETWKDVKFDFQKHKDTEYFTARLGEEDFEMLEEDQTKVTAMLGSRYLATFEDEIQEWNKNLDQVNNVISNLREVQQNWGYLENLFIHSEEVRKELPKESDEFVLIDADVKMLLKEAKKKEFAIVFSTQAGYLEKIEQANEKLVKCEKALQRFMEAKRTCFPRFYFVSPADLLDILSNGNLPEKVMPHLPKIFQAINDLKLDMNTGVRPAALGMISCVGVEYVTFSEPLKLLGKVESYMQDVIDSMRLTLRLIAGESWKKSLANPRTEWLKMDCSQCTLLVALSAWVDDVEKGMANNSMPQTLKNCIDQLTALIKMVQDSSMPGDLRMKVMCLITMDAHSRDIIGILIDEGVKQTDEFQWQSQMKSYWDPSCDDFALKIADASFYYGYEYLGNGPRLVVTPLTDRIYVTATQALHLKMGCAPSGPAGTGKTETTKDLSSSMGKAIYVFNCSDQMDYLGLAGIFKGLAASGSWGCFDEFNRLLPSVLSVCSVQYKCVTDAIKAGVKRFVIQGDEIALDPSNGAYITMNPGYIGRAELPEGLKALFRPITVVVPDLELICQNMLMAEGFVDAIDLARKFRTLYALCKDLLSAAKHYDWGLRAIKSVLVVAGGFKRAEPDMPENAILMRALRDFNLPKIAAEDLEVFGGLLGDLFPGINPVRMRDMEFEGKINAAAAELQMFPDEAYILKVVQLGELLAIRHCVFTMGPPGCGKSKTWQTLAKANQLNGQKTAVVPINPKVVNTNEFYGVVHIQTREWIDGLFSCKLREYSKETDTNPKWIILDGDLDANWIESMNSVMDDNKLLTLASNERIAVKGHMKLIFEIRNLNHATPATVSRAGILYISDDDGTQWRSYVKSWIKYSTYNAERKEALQNLFDKYLDETYQKMRKFFKNIVPNVVISQVNAICKLLEVMLAEQEVKGLEFIFVFCMIWCMGAGLEIMEGNKSRISFDKFWRETWKTIKFPTKGTVFDYYVDIENSKMEDWNKLRNDSIESSIDTAKPITNYTIPTADTIASQYLMKKFLKINVPPMLVGSAGCGKTQIIKGLLNELTEKGDAYSSQIINFNFFTDSTLLQKVLESQLEKKGGAGIGPAKGKLIYFVDDLNMPKLDPYETQTAIALVRQSLDYSHWYDKQKLVMKKILNTQYVAAMNATAGSFIINPRLQRWFWLLAVNFPETNSLNTIYSAFMLKHFAKFKGTISEQVVPVIKSTLALHREVSAKFRKTAANFHYEFNVRHLTNVFQGLLTAKVEAIKEPDHLVKLWVHECERIYGDRLVTPEHLTQYRDICADLCKMGFSKYNMNKYFAKPTPEPLVFAQFTESLDDKLYQQFENVEKLTDMCNLALREYNELNAVMPLVLFEDAMKHVCKVTRIISAAQGHALMVGVGGSGKQSLSKLASFICQFSTTGIVISSTYSVNDFKVDLQTYFQKAGVKDEGLMFLFTEGQIKSENYLVFINDLLSSGEIADLFVQEDIDGIINAVTPAAKSDGVNPTPGPVWKYFIDRVKKNLHMTLCMSPSDEFRARARKFPAIINCTVIDWFHPWPQEALLSVARKFIEEVEMASEEERDAVVNFLPFSFTTVQDFSAVVLQAERRFIYTTPKSFLELIKLFKSMLAVKRKELEDNREKYDRGVIKLQQTQEQIAELEEVLKVTSVTVEEKKKFASEQAEIVGAEKDKVTIQSDIAGAESIKCAKIAHDVQEMMTSVQKDLDQALPALAAAEKALDGLNVKDFQMLKALANPPGAVKDTFACVIHLLCTVDPSIPVDKKGRLHGIDPWKCVSLQLKSPPAFLEKLKNYKNEIEAKKVPAINFQQIQVFLDDPEFTVEIIKAKSECAGGLCDWVKNIAIFYDVFTNVAPKQAKAELAAIQLEEANTKKATMEAEVAELNAALKILQDKFQEVMDDKEAAEAEAAKCASKLDMANRLIAALGSESTRWANAIIQLDDSITKIIGDVLLASAFVSYVGPFNKKFRNKIMEEKFVPFFKQNNIPMSPEANPLLILTNPAQIANWNNQNLPSDEVSVQNGSILSASERYSLIIDPQLQGITWLREKEAKSDMQITRLTNPKLVKTVEASIESGKPVLIENLLNAIDAVLQPVYARSIVKKGRNRYLKMGDKELSLHANFNLYLHTKLSNPHYQPEIQAECTLINFTVTEGGLEDQLLDLVVLMERPDLAAQSIELIQMQNNFKITLGELEADLLQRLANSTGDILEDVPLVENLERSKALSVEIAAKVLIAQETQVQIKEASEFYRPSASRGALVFFMMNELFMIHSFYRFSLDSFIIVVKRAITIVADRMAPKKKEKAEPVEGEEGAEVAEAEAEPSEEEEEDGGQMSPRTLGIRVDALTDEITYQAFNYTRRGTFERHKLLLATLLTFRIQIRKGLLEQGEVDALINNSVALDVPNQPENLKMIHEAFWPSVVGLQKVKVFSDLIKQMESEALQWRKWYADAAAESCELPRAHKDISLFHRMLLLRAMRPDRLSGALTQFVTETMGEAFVEQPSFNFFNDYKESTKDTPLFFVLFPGEDPTPIIERVGAAFGKKISERTLTNISMGQGQEKVAEDCLIDSAKNGKWIILQNVHLMIDWMRGFERKLEVAVADDCHEDFRCYITSEPPPLDHQEIIPEAILQNSIKIANEAPQNLKANLRRAFSKFEQEEFEKAKSHKEKEYKALLFGLCMFHSLILGRKKFGAQGWSRNYNFNDGDLTICGQVIHNYLARYEKVPYADLRYIFGDIMYGGHITDDWDRRCNSTYLLKLIKPEILQQMQLTMTAGFKSPIPEKFDRERYEEYIEKSLPAEIPQMFGLHPNAEIGYLTTQANSLFAYIQQIQGGASTGGGGDGAGEIFEKIYKFQDMCPETFQMLDLFARATERPPFIVVCLQECERMNKLLVEIKSSLSDLDAGLKGTLNITEAMEGLSYALTLNLIPPGWQACAYLSKKGLLIWLEDLILRCAQLERWSEEFATPMVLWLSALFNPMSFLTAIMQITARATNQPLDEMCLRSDVTNHFDITELTEYPETGSYVNGFTLEGAGWEIGRNGEQGYLCEMVLKELSPEVPTIHVSAVRKKDRPKVGRYICPVYFTTNRGGANFVTYFDIAMESEDTDEKNWILSGVSLFLAPE